MSHCGLGLSCEPVKEEKDRTQYLSSCIHGMVDYCYKCERALMDKVMELVTRIESLHEFKLRQIDENRKISRRVDGLFETLEAYNQDAEHLDSSLPKRIEKLEQLNQQCFEANPIKAIYDKFEKIESKIACLMQKSTLNDEKRPFKCPVCDGRGVHKKEMDPKILNFEVCLTCKGNGIVWS